MAQKGPEIKSGEYLRNGDCLVSANGCFCAYLHDDGNLCIYNSPSPDSKTNIWCSGRPTSQGPKCVYLHDDGNLCIYNSSSPDAKTNIWCSGRPTSQGPKCVYLHDDGNLCIYNSPSPDAKTNIWCSGPTVQHDISKYAGTYYLSTAANPGFLYPLVVEANGDVYLAKSIIRYQFDYCNATLTFDWQTIDKVERQGRVTFSKGPDGKKTCSGSIISKNPNSTDNFIGTQMFKTQVWATPATSSLKGSVGDHTWITMNDYNCWNVLGGGPGYYCKNRWSKVGNTPVYFPPEGRLLNSTGGGNVDMANCLGGQEKKFLGLPWYAGIVYGLNGVCHQMTNRLLLSADKLTVSGANGYALSCVQYGRYGTIGSLEFIAGYFGPLLPLVAPAILAFLAGIQIEFGVRCGECHAPYPGPLLLEQTTLEAHEAIRQMSADDFYSTILDKHQSHLEELRQVFITKAGVHISEGKIEKIMGLYNEILCPSKALTQDIFSKISTASKMEQDMPELNANQRTQFADKYNERVNSQQKKVANYLTRNEYITLFDFDPDQNVVLVDPSILMLENRI